MDLLGPVIAGLGLLKRLAKGNAPSQTQQGGAGSTQVQQSGSSPVTTIINVGLSDAEIVEVVQKLTQVVDRLAPKPERENLPILPGILISQASISSSGALIGEARNVASVGDDGTGDRHILFNQPFATPNYHVSISPPNTRVDITKRNSDLNIQILDDNGEPIDKAIEVIVTGEAGR